MDLLLPLLLPPLLGILAGPQPVVPTVPDGTSTVVVRLDGEEVAVVEEGPWSFTVDLGSAPSPHRLTAEAFDDLGTSLGSATRRLNQAPHPEHLTVSVVDRGDGSGLLLRLGGGSELGTPEAVHAFADGRALEAAGPGLFELAPPDPAADLPLVVQLVHGGNLVERGRFLLRRREGAWTVEPARVRAISAVPEAAASWRTLGEGGVPPGLAGATILGGGGGVGGDVVVVLHPEARGPLRALYDAAWEGLLRGPGSADAAELAAPLGSRDRIFLLSPENARGVRPAARELFANSPFYELDRGGIADTGLSWYLARIAPPPSPLRIADAVAVAGRLAASADRPRAVVLVTVPGEDGSALSPGRAAAYLRDLHVPLRVWVPGEGTAERMSEWGHVTPLPSHGHLQHAVLALRELLAAQRVVWWPGEEVREPAPVPAGTPLRSAGAEAP